MSSGISWDARAVRWFRDAAGYTGYARAMASLLLEDIRERSTLCDVGCGAGEVDLELSRHIGDITCVDKDAWVLSDLAAEASARGVKNLRVLHRDAMELEGRWDTVLTLFCGDPGELGDRLLSLAGDRLIIVTHAAREGMFGPEGRRSFKNFNDETTRAWLEKRGIEYRYRAAALEYGQPFPSREEAAVFVSRWEPEIEKAELQAYLSSALVETKTPEFPFYLPAEKHFGIFTIDA